MGGANRTSEAQKLAKGINILVATPDRLLDHLENTRDFLCMNLQCIKIHEAARILNVGFEEEMKKIVNLLPKTNDDVLDVDWIVQFDPLDDPKEYIHHKISHKEFHRKALENYRQ